MERDRAIELINNYWMHHDCNHVNFIKYLYKNGYMIISPIELEKINGMTIMAHIHGMNPFEEKKL